MYGQVMKSLIYILLFLQIYPVSAAWETSESEHFRVYYKKNTVDPESILRIAEEFYGELPRITENIPSQTIKIWVCDTQEAFQDYVHAPIQDWAVGCAFPLSRRIIIQNPKQIATAKLQLAQVLRHEIAHVLFGQYTRKAVKGIPLWFVEGIAIHFSKEWVPGRHKILLERVFTNSIYPLHVLSHKFPVSQRGANLAYAQSQDTLRWFVEVNGNEALWAIIDHLHTGANLNTAFEAVLGYDLTTFDRLWQESLPERYHWAAFLSNSYVFWSSIGGLLLLCYIITRNRRRRHLKKLRQQEEAVDAFFIE